MNKKAKALSVIREYSILTAATLLMTVGIYAFRFPNNFSFGGVTGLAVVLAKYLPCSASLITTVLNIILLIVGVFTLGKSFGVKTAYVTILSSVFLNLAELFFPMAGSLTDQPILELLFAVGLPGFASAVFFNMGASSGGTDIIAMIIKKHTSIDTGMALLTADAVIAALPFFVFDVKTGLFSICGLIIKSLVIDEVIENINLCKVFTIICDDPEPICDFITHTLHRSATVQEALGAYTHSGRHVIITIVRRHQAIDLRNFIKKTEPNAFIAITNSSEIIGKGFRSNI